MQNYDMIPVISGNTFPGVQFNLPVNIAYSLVGATVTMMLRATYYEPPVAEYIMDIVSDYVFEMPPMIINAKAGDYLYDILIIFADGRRKTFIGGRWSILNVVTKA